jgi:hypothetical protein
VRASRINRILKFLGEKNYGMSNFDLRLYPAFNVQVVVDHTMRIRSFSIRSGSHNDKSVYNKSAFRTKVHEHLPQGAFFLADAGYTLSTLLITPYKIIYGMPSEQAKFNYFHSKIRMTVERSLGLLKGKWRRLDHTLVGKSPQNITKLIRGAMILHNWLLNDKVNIGELNEDPDLQNDVVLDEREERNAVAQVKRDQVCAYINAFM